MANLTLLESDDDFEWLGNVHLTNRDDLDKYEVALIYGNEDFPNHIELYQENDVREFPLQLFQGEDFNTVIKE